MMTPEELKGAASAEIDRRGHEAVALSKEILNAPEAGFREVKTAARVAEAFRRLSIPFEDGIAVTGLKAVLDSGRPGPTVAVMAELDSLIVPGHPHADPETGAAHACGHHCQIGALMAVATGLMAPGVMEELSGRVALVVVPAEEYIEIGYRDELRRDGALEFLAGKPEFIRLGALDDVDMAMMTHTVSSPETAKFAVGGSNNGMVAKLVRFEGVAAHAGAAPHAGVNALNASMIALTAINAQRETHRDEDSVRIHPIITRGGAAVSSVPADVRLETFVRARSVEAVTSAAAKVDRALRAGALAVGGSVTIQTLPGYFPIRSDESMVNLFRRNASDLVGADKIVNLGHRSGSTDMGDVSQLMPVIHPYVRASAGRAHGADYLIDDYELAVPTAAKAMAMTVIDLLSGGAKRAHEIKAAYKAPMTKERYLSLLRSILDVTTYRE